MTLDPMRAPALRGLARRDFTKLEQAERWQPPAFGSPTTLRAKAVAVVRRALDLQAASIWNDLVPLLGAARGTVLDVGAGAQPYRGLLSPDVTYRAIDVKLAEAFGYDQPDTTYYEGDRWPVDDAKVDIVFATETLEHVPDPPAFLSEARRVLVDGGQVLLTVPFSARWHYIPHDYWRFTPSSLQNLLEEAGFGEVQVYARGNEVTVAVAKSLGLILAALLPPGGGVSVRRLLAALTLPLVAVLAAVGQVSLRGQGGDDCLGWTVLATAAPRVADDAAPE
ncbi:MAG: class I SAM-dependent methyltransferase [Solirubrobacteraceae bacterium]|nr:class I SAM-dependent methyltransferase [Solirubrobacteraceae bacterium]